MDTTKMANSKLDLENISDLGERCLYLQKVIQEELQGLVADETIKNIKIYVFEELFKNFPDVRNL